MSISVRDWKRPTEMGHSPLYRVRQRSVLFRVGAQKPEHDHLVRTFVRLFVEQVPPVREQVVGGGRPALRIRPAVDQHSGGRFGHREALGGEFGIGAIHEVFALGCLYFVFGMDGMNVIVHPGAVEDEETVRGIRSSEILEL